MPNLVGLTLKGRYRVEEWLGSGGMAEVYKVWDIRRSTYLALKLLREELTEDVIFLRRFRREAKILETLQHPNIVRFYGLEQDGDLTFMLMDYIEGSTLRKEIKDTGQPYSPQRILQILQPVCAALNYAHQIVVHCDVKPANIMIDRSKRVLVTDFGIARLTEGTTTTLVGAGAPAYMAPEQIRGEKPTQATDIYALGLVLFEMLTGGERPFTGEKAQITGSTAEKVRWEHLRLQPPSPRLFNRDISPEIEAIVMKCLEKEPSRRFGSVMELLASMEKAIPEDTLWHPPRPPRPRPALAFQLTLLGVAIIAIAFWAGPRLLNIIQVPIAENPLPFPTIDQPTAHLSQTPVPPTLTPTLLKQTSTPKPPTTTPRPLSKTSLPQPANLSLQVNSFCRGGPGTSYDKIWTFSSGDRVNIVGQDDDWWLISFSDQRTRHDHCWIHSDNGIASGDLSTVPYSDYRTQK